MRLLLFLLTCIAAQAASITGKVVGVSDGDTITVLTAAKESVKVRLHGIDAPEARQAFGRFAVEVVQRDRYGRSIGRVFVGDINVNVEMVRRGFAWWYRQYAKKDGALAAAEARAAKRGLCVDKNPVPPWEFRRNPSKAQASVEAMKTRTRNLVAVALAGFGLLIAATYQPFGSSYHSEKMAWGRISVMCGAPRLCGGSQRERPRYRIGAARQSRLGCGKATSLR
jgi:endonuclease YncB( thermonuclease family)